MEENKMYDAAKGLIKYRLKSVVTNRRIKDNLTGETIEIDISDMDQIKSATKESVMRPTEFMNEIKEEIKEEFDYIVQNFDSIYENVYIELLEESEKSRTLVVSEQEELDESLSDIVRTARRVNNNIDSIIKEGKDTSKVLKDYREGKNKEENEEQLTVEEREKRIAQIEERFDKNREDSLNASRKLTELVRKTNENIDSIIKNGKGKVQELKDYREHDENKESEENDNQR